MKFTFLAVIAITFCAAWISPQSEAHLIYHDNNVQLKWKDYQGTVEEDANITALTSIGFRMGYKGTARQDSLIVVVEAFFDKQNSWVKKDTTAYALKHEQLHFDITELYARKLKQSIQSASLTYKNYQSVLRDLERKAHNDMNTADSIYEVATDYSKNKVEQKKWNDNIAVDLSNLKAFEADTFKVPVRF